MTTKKLNQVLGSFVLVSLLFSGLSAMKAPWLYAAPASAVTVQGSQTAMVNINKAGLDELQTIRGIGPVFAQRIVEYRDQNGPFKTAEDLAKVRGIGNAKLEKMKSQVTI